MLAKLEKIVMDDDKLMEEKKKNSKYTTTPYSLISMLKKSIKVRML